MAVNSSELFVEQIGHQSFLSPWCHPNLYYQKGNYSKEFGDLTVIFENTAIIFSDKNISFDVDTVTHVAWKRWYKRSIEKSVGQLLGALRQLRMVNKEIYTDAKLKSRFAGELPTIEHLNVHLVGVTHNLWNSPENVRLKIASEISNNHVPFVTGCHFDGEFVHIIEGNALYVILSRLDTVRDFIAFLRDRKATLSKTHCMIEGDENFLAAYLDAPIAPGRYSVSRQLPADPRRTVLFQHWLWEDYAMSESWQHTVKENRQSYLIDRLIEHLSEEYSRKRMVVSQDRPFTYHENGWRMLARESRFSRRMISRALYSILEEKDKTTFWISSVPSADYPDTRYVLTTYPPANVEDRYDDFERHIFRHLTDHMYAAGSAFKPCRFIIGVSLPNYEHGQKSVLLTIMDKTTWTEADRQDAARIRRRLGVFKSIHAETTMHFD